MMELMMDQPEDGRRAYFFMRKYRFWRKFACSYLYPHWLWSFVITPSDYENLLNNAADVERPALAKRLLHRVVWFWPRLRDAALWAKSDSDSSKSPVPFSELEPKSLVLLDAVMRVCPDRAAPMLELGCNCGRYLNALTENGYTDLSAVDISSVALSYMDERFPGLKARCKVALDCFQHYLIGRSDLQFEVTYTHGGTIELVHPSFPIVKEIARVTKSAVVLLIQENGHAYPRFWEAEFERYGFGLFTVIRPAVEDEIGTNSTSLLVFRRISEMAKVPHNTRSELSHA